MLKGEKVCLRPVKRSDIELFLKWFNDQEVIQYIAAYLPLTEGREEKWLEEIMEKQEPTFVIEAILPHKKTKPIGDCSFGNWNRKDRVAYFGIVIGEKNFWSKGYGIEAANLLINYGFNDLNLNRIDSSALAFNERSIRMHKKLGFVEEGRKRKHIYVNGRYEDLVIFGLLRDEWFKRKI